MVEWYAWLNKIILEKEDELVAHKVRYFVHGLRPPGCNGEKFHRRRMQTKTLFGLSLPLSWSHSISERFRCSNCLPSFDRLFPLSSSVGASTCVRSNVSDRHAIWTFAGRLVMSWDRIGMEGNKGEKDWQLRSLFGELVRRLAARCAA